MFLALYFDPQHNISWLWINVHIIKQIISYVPILVSQITLVNMVALPNLLPNKNVTSDDSNKIIIFLILIIAPLIQPSAF